MIDLINNSAGPEYASETQVNDPARFRAVSASSTLPALPREPMATSALINRLQNVVAERGGMSGAQLFKRIEAALFEKPMQLTPLDSSLPNISLKPRALISIFNPIFKIKGSAVDRLITPKKEMSLKGLNDIDLSLEVKSLDSNGIRRKLAQVLRQSKSGVKSGQAGFKQLSDEALVKAYARSWLEGNGFVKVRLNVQEGSLPLDLVLHQDLAAEFDVIRASNVIEVNAEQKSARIVSTVSARTQQWLDSQSLLFLHDNMDGGLTRIQKWLSKLPKGKIVQPESVLRALYAKDTPENQSRFLTWLVGRGDSASIQHLAPVFQAVHSAHKEALAQFEEGVLPARFPMDLLLDNLSIAQCPEELTPDYCERIMRCVRVFPDCAKPLASALATDAPVLEAAIGAVVLLPQIDANTLADLWQNHAPANPQVPLLLDSVTRHFRELGRLSSTLGTFQGRYENPAAELNALTQWLQTPEEGYFTRANLVKRSSLLVSQLLEEPPSQQHIPVMERLAHLLEPRDLKSFKPGALKLSRAQAEFIREQSPALSQFLSFVELRHEVVNGAFRLDESNEPMAVFERCEELWRKRDSLPTTATYVSRSGTFDGGRWLDLGGSSCLITEDRVYIGGLLLSGQKPLPQGAGLSYHSKSQAVTFGQYKNGALQDGDARVASAAGSFRFPMVGTLVSGSGQWKPAASPVIDRVIDVLDDFCGAPNDERSAKDAVITAEWRDPLDTILFAPLTHVKRGVLTYKSPVTGENASVTLRAGIITSGSVVPFRGDTTKELCISASATGESLLQLKGAIVRHRDIHGGPRDHVVRGDYDLDTRHIQGTGVVKTAEYVFNGELERSMPHGRGQIIKEGETYGRLVLMKNGVIEDLGLERFAQGRDPLTKAYEYTLGVARDVPIRPYELPDLDDTSYFSVENESGGRLYGLWEQRQAFGVLRPSRVTRDVMIGAFKFVAPRMYDFLLAALSPESSPIWSIPYEGMDDRLYFSEEFVQPLGYMFQSIPHGPVSLVDSITGDSSHRVFIFGQLLPETKLVSTNGNISVFRQVSDSRQFFLFDKHSAVYNIRVPAKYADDWSGFMRSGVTVLGSATVAGDHYFGEIKSLRPHGKGRRSDVEGTTVQGMFTEGILRSGTVTYQNGVVITGTWDTQGLKGQIRLRVPIEEDFIEFDCQMHGSDILQSAHSREVKGCLYLVTPGPLNQALANLGCELTMTEMRYLQAVDAY